MNIYQKCAEILVERGYAYNWKGKYRMPVSKTKWPYLQVNENQAYTVEVDPFADTLEGRRQLDVIEDWFESQVFKDEPSNAFILWHESGKQIGCDESCHKWRKDRIERCLNKLIGG